MDIVVDTVQKRIVQEWFTLWACDGTPHSYRFAAKVT